MSKISKIIILIMTILLYQCNGKNFPQEIPKIIKLTENDTTIIEQIDNIIFYKDFFIVLEKLNSKIIYYNYYGNIIDCIKPNIQLADSLVGKFKFIDTSLHCIPLSKVQEILKPYGKENLEKNFKMLKNQFGDILKLSDSLILINSSIYGYANRLNDTDKIRKLFNCASLLCFNIFSKDFQIFPMEYERYYAPQNSKICLSPFSKNSIIAFAPSLIPFHFNKENKKIKYDSIWGLCEFSITGKFQRFISRLPAEYVESELFSFTYPINISNSEILITAYRDLPRLYLYGKTEKILKLPNIEISNLVFFNKVSKANDKVSKNNLLKKINDYYNFSIKNIDFVNDSTIIQVVYHIKQNNEWVNYLMYLNLNGKLISNKKINLDKFKDPYIKLNNVFYDPLHHLNVYILINENGWSLSFERLEI